MKKNCSFSDEDLFYIDKSYRLESLKDALLTCIRSMGTFIFYRKYIVNLKETYETIRKSNSYRKS